MKAQSILACVSLVVSCASAREVRPYDSPERRLEASPDALRNAIRRVVAEQGWQTIYCDDEGGRVEALAPEESVAGMVMRERWNLSIVGHTVRVRRALEIRWDMTQQQWHSTDEVCSLYGYAREAMVLNRIEAALQDGPYMAMSYVPGMP